MLCGENSGFDVSVDVAVDREAGEFREGGGVGVDL